MAYPREEATERTARVPVSILSAVGPIVEVAGFRSGIPSCQKPFLVVTLCGSAILATLQSRAEQVTPSLANGGDAASEKINHLGGAIGAGLGTGLSGGGDGYGEPSGN